MEAMVQGQQEKKGQFPRFITCPNEVRYRQFSLIRLVYNVEHRQKLIPCVDARRWLPFPWLMLTPAIRRNHSA